MDNGNKISTILSEYNTIPKTYLTSDEIYDVDCEYRKTSKNRPIFEIILIGGLLLFTGLGIIITSISINKNMHSVKVDIDSFKSVNLQRLLDTTGRVQALYDSAVNQRNMLERRHVEDLQQLESTAHEEISFVQLQGLSSEDENAKIRQINIKLSQEKESLEELYIAEIFAIDARISEYQEQIENFDLEALREAQKELAVFNSENVRFELEKKQLRRQYEIQIDQLLTRIERKRDTDAKSQSKRMDEVALSYKERIKMINEQIESNNAEFEEMSKKYNTILDERNKSLALLQRYNTFFQTVARRNGDAGYILDTTNSAKDGILVYVDPVYGINFNNQKAIVFRTGNDYIGTLNISGVAGNIKAKIVEQAPGRNFQANDIILLDMAP
ncbi:MAG: hypothetical protein Ta2F_16280 [Termitinemataceae bacterium]|nr:MAG: hypothetical protein Ta2F_16280 [Termitinemataceae bacterium]